MWVHADNIQHTYIPVCAGASSHRLPRHTGECTTVQVGVPLYSGGTLITYSTPIFLSVLVPLVIVYLIIQVGVPLYMWVHADYIQHTYIPVCVGASSHRLPRHTGRCTNVQVGVPLYRYVYHCTGMCTTVQVCVPLYR